MRNSERAAAILPCVWARRQVRLRELSNFGDLTRYASPSYVGISTAVNLNYSVTRRFARTEVWRS